MNPATTIFDTATAAFLKVLGHIDYKPSIAGLQGQMNYCLITGCPLPCHCQPIPSPSREREFWFGCGALERLWLIGL
ncbi:MAG: hypothetical protein GH152_00655 [Dehalococcoidia bacterium]|nr:hypothetical protein [Dehalococcoidia bacterium]